MNISKLIYIFILSITSFYLTWISLLKLIPFFKKNIVDNPIKRSSHKKPTPTSGGIVFSIIGSLFTAINGFYIPIISMPLSIVGFIDDKKEISSSIRYISQIIISFFLFFDSPLKENLTNYPILLTYLIIIFISTAIINFCNFIDGLDGLLISCMTITLTTLALSQHNIFPLIGCLIAFTIFNWSPAKIFMGDSGSTFLGAVFVGLLMKNNNFLELIKSILLITPILADCIFCLIRRLASGQNIFKPHKLHLYQRLNQAGWSHMQVSTLYSFGVFILSLTYLTQGVIACLTLSIIEIIIGFYLDKNYSKSFYDIKAN